MEVAGGELQRDGGHKANRLTEVVSPPAAGCVAARHPGVQPAGHPGVVDGTGRPRETGKVMDRSEHPVGIIH